ncbi:hypothetical protein HW845_06175 [Streptomyces sp. ND05-3B]|nr:hypothetical protein [Streptomyces caniscabiei]MBE4755334.1 hypothetical protein [Streptomyces caniscabiei]MBE4772542.1 hypothetical protein [Streptomyces caniscabiei]MBE4783381.1 hypothetical protein [Streptomyces caniscabiei]MBE4792685.1 hypothetical protein [Streptomyces caniscabiei]
MEAEWQQEERKAAFDALGDRRGAAVALDAETGELLAVVSTPSYDPSAFSGCTTADGKAWRDANADTDEPMLNRALRETTAPGETFDIVVAAAALDHGLHETAERGEGGRAERLGRHGRSPAPRSAREGGMGPDRRRPRHRLLMVPGIRPRRGGLHRGAGRARGDLGSRRRRARHRGDDHGTVLTRPTP